MYKKLFASLLLTSCISGTAMAGGYQLQEYSMTNLGRAFGGAGVAGDDYSAIALNPAGMVLKGTGLQTGAAAAFIRAHANGSLRSVASPDTLVSSGKGKLDTNALMPHFFGQTKLGEKFRLGAGLYVPFGLGTYYRKNWFGKTHAINSEIKVTDLAVALAYQLTDTISIGASALMEYVDARLTNAANPEGTAFSDLNADGWAPGWSAGIMYQPQKETRFGIAYRAKVHHDIKGPHYIAGTKHTCGTSLTFPEHVLMSAYHEIGKWGLSAMARWTRWTQFDLLNIRSTYSPTGYLPPVAEDWKNVWTVGGGVDYHYDQNWTYRAGLAYDQGAVKRAANRTARVPDSNRIQTSVGLSYTKDNWQFDAAYMHLFWKSASSYNKNGATILDAKHRVHMDILGLSVQYHF